VSSLVGRERRTVAITAAIAVTALSACGSSSTSHGAGSSAPPTASPSTTAATSTATASAAQTTSTAARTTTANARTAPDPPVAGTGSVPAGLAGREWTLLPTRRKLVALTFDAGANADGVARILATLTHEHVPATMFLTGDFVQHFKAAARQIVRAGMRVGDHSISHPYFTKLTDALIRTQVLSARAEIISVTGADPRPWFRFPYGDRSSHTIAVVNSVGFVPLGWTVDTLGWMGTSGGVTVTSVVSRVLAHLQPGEIVLMHCGSNPNDHSTLDADALATVIKKLRSRGYSFVTPTARSLVGSG
jgi:peptidoglycan/xylan/chitin deacetylase (PgdA/CDA1 family)